MAVKCSETSWLGQKQVKAGDIQEKVPNLEKFVTILNGWLVGSIF